MFSGRTTTTVTAPAAAPIDLNSAGRPDWRELGPLFGLILLAVVPTAAGGAMVVANWPREALSGWQALWLALGGVLAFVGGSFVWTLRGTVLHGIKSYYARVDDWHYAALTKYEEGDGQITAHQVSEWVYTEADMRHVMLAALWLIIAQPKSLSIQQLTRGPLQITLGGHRAYKVLDMSQDGAGSFLNMAARAGIIQGRDNRKAGTFLAMDPRQMALKLLTEAAKNPATVTQSSEG